MLRVGVPAVAVKNKMRSMGIDPDLLDKPDAMIPVGDDDDSSDGGGSSSIGNDETPDFSD